MSHKGKVHAANHERWLISYADFITLLFALFVVLFAASESDKHKKQQLVEALESAFDRNVVIEPRSAADLSSLSQMAPETAEMMQVEARIRAAIQRQVAQHKLAPGAVTTRVSRDGLVISIQEAGFFDSGSASIRTGALEVLRAVLVVVPHEPMRIEGHTDNVPIHTAMYATNWELSTARAATMTRVLLSEKAVDPDEVSAAGYAEFHPVADNATAEGRGQNRRVDIILLAAKVKAAAVPAPAPAALALTVRSGQAPLR